MQPEPVDRRMAPPISFPIALICIVLVAIDLRPGIVSMGPLLPLIRQQFAISNAEASLLTVIPAALMGLLAFPTPWLVGRYGRNRVILSALVVLAAATLARAFVGSFGLLLASTCGVGAGIAVVGTLIPGYAKQTFPSRAASLMGLYAMAIGLGGTIAAALAGVLMTAGVGWRLGSGIFVVPGVTAIAAWFVLSYLERSSPVIEAPRQTSAPRGLPIDNPAAWLIALYFACNNFLFFGLVSWTAPIYREFGMSTTAGSMLLACFTAVFMLSNPLAGFISRTDDRRMAVGSFAGLTVVGTLAIATVPHLLPFVFVPMIAVGVGGSFTLAMILPLDSTVDADEANTWTAFVMGVGYFLGGLGPLVVGIVRDRSGSFETSLWLFVAMAVVMAMVAPFLKPPQR